MLSLLNLSNQAYPAQIWPSCVKAVFYDFVYPCDPHHICNAVTFFFSSNDRILHFVDEGSHQIKGNLFMEKMSNFADQLRHCSPILFTLQVVLFKMGVC